MSTVDLTAGQVMDMSAALLNDTQKQVYTYQAQTPYLNMALQELQELFELNEVPVTSEVSAVIPIPVGYDHIAFNNGVYPTLPADFTEPIALFEQNTGAHGYNPMMKVTSLPKHIGANNSFIVYVWESNEIRFLPSVQVNNIKIDYIRNLFVPIVDENSQLYIGSAKSFLEYRNAALCAEFIGENSSRATSLNGFCELAIDRAIGIGSKGRQNITIRKRPFRASYKRQ